MLSGVAGVRKRLFVFRIYAGDVCVFKFVNRGLDKSQCFRRRVKRRQSAFGFDKRVDLFAEFFHLFDRWLVDYFLKLSRSA